MATIHTDSQPPIVGYGSVPNATDKTPVNPTTQQDIHQTVNDDLTETESEKRKRHFSLVIVYVCYLNVRLQEFVYAVSIWNYLLHLEPDTSIQFLGFIHLTTNATTFVSSILFGKLSNLINSTKIPIQIGSVMMSVGSFMMALPHLCAAPNSKWVIWAARLLICCGNGSQANLTAYMAMASKVVERNLVFSNRSCLIALSVIIGSGIQLVFAGIMTESTDYGPIRLDMYTLPAFVSCLAGTVCVVVLHLYFKESWVAVAGHHLKSENKKNFKNRNIPASSNSSKGRKKSDDQSVPLLEESAYIPPLSLKTTPHPPPNEPPSKLVPPDKITVAVCYLVRFMFMFSLAMALCVLPPLTILFFNWSPANVLFYNSLVLVLANILRLFMNLAVPSLLKRFEERVLVILGLITTIGFFLALFSWPGMPNIKDHQINQSSINHYQSLVITDFNQTNTPHHGDHYASMDVMLEDGRMNCSQSWCSTTTIISQHQFVIAHVLFYGFSLTLGLCVSSILFSKALGPIKQGTYQGTYQAIGYVAAMTAPPIATLTLEHYGPLATWGVGLLVAVVTTVINCACFKHQVPYGYHDKGYSRI